jgi:hypothetical protein
MKSFKKDVGCISQLANDEHAGILHGRTLGRAVPSMLEPLPPALRRLLTHVKVADNEVVVAIAR